MSNYKKTDCPVCGGKNSFSVKENGYGHCWRASCQFIQYPDKNENTSKYDLEFTPIDGFAVDLNKRCISQKTCDKYGYEVGYKNGQLVHIMNYRNTQGKLIAQKFRDCGKNFTWEGDSQSASLFGKALFSPSEKVSITITEGEIDALSLAEVWDCKWPVVSLKGGVQSAASNLEKNLDWLKGFKHVVLCFDNDGTAEEAIERCVELFPPGFVKIARLPLKDASDMLVAGRVKELINCIYNAQDARPDSILSGDQVIELLENYEPEIGFSIKYPVLNGMMRGLHKRRLTLVTAPPGGGKSLFLKEIALNMVQNHGLRIGSAFLEESLSFSVAGYLGLYTGKPAYLIAEQDNFINRPEYKEAVDKLFKSNKIVSYDHFGSIDRKSLLSQLEYFAVAEKVDFIILDHISLVISGMRSSREGERKDIDILMTELRSLIQRTGVGILAVSHSKRKNTRDLAAEDGGRIRLSDLRGSGSLEQLSDFVIGIERDQQSVEHSNEACIRVLKNRLTGKLGEADNLCYNDKTGSLELNTGFNI